MNTKLLFLIISVIFISACSQSPDYDIVGDSVVYNDSNVFFNVSPHTLTQTGSPILTFESKLYSGDIDLLFGFNTDTAQPTASRVYNPHNVTRSYTCPAEYSYNYTTNPNYLWCYYTVNKNGTLSNVTVFEHSFTTGNIPLRTIYWIEEVEWSNWNPWQVYNYEFMGMNKWYVAKDIPIVNDTTYKLQYDITVKQYFNRQNSGKYFIALKPSSESIEEAIQNGHFYYLDPWWNATYLTSSLLSYYDFEDISTGKLIDTKTKDGNGTINNVDTNDIVTGILGNAIMINKTNAFINLTNSTRWQVNNITVNFWIKPRSHNGATQAVINKDRIGDNPNDFSMSILTGNKMYGEINGSSLRASIPPVNTNWIMVTYVLINSSGNPEIYINGTSMNGSASTGGWVSNNNTIVIGNAYTSLPWEGGTYENVYNGSIDELSIWNTSLTPTQISDLYNSGLGFNPVSDLAAEVVTEAYMRPLTAYSNTALNCSVFTTVSDGGNYNLSINVTQNNTLNLTYNYFDQANGTTIENLFSSLQSVGSVWNCTVLATAYNNSNYTDLYTSNTITISNFEPSFDHGELPDLQIIHTQNITTDFNCSDIDTVVGQTLSYNVSNLTKDLTNVLTINTSSGIVFGNPSYYDVGNYSYNITCSDGINKTSQIFDVNITQNMLFAQSDSPDPILEGNTETFKLYINITNYTYQPTNVVLTWHNLTFIPNSNQSSIVGDVRYYNYSVITGIPIGYGLTSGYLTHYNWSFDIGDAVTDYNTSNNSLTVYSIGLDNCSSLTQDIFNWTLKDEGAGSILSTNDSDIQGDFILTSIGNTSYAYNFSTQWYNVSSGKVCIPSSILGTNNFTIDITLSYVDDGYVQEFFFLDQGTLDDTNNFNSHTTHNVTIYDLLLSDSTTFLFSFFDKDGLRLEDSIVHVFRQYIGEGVFREVERAKADENGETHVHLVEEDVIYYWMITQNGTVYYTSSIYQARCLDTPCSITLQEGSSYTPFDEIGPIDGGVYSIQTNTSDRKVRLNFVLDKSSEINMTIYKYDNDPEEIEEVASDQLIATAGTLEATVPQSAGNVTFFAVVRQDGEQVKSYWVNMKRSAQDLFPNGLGIFMTVLIVLALILMTASEGSPMVFFAIIGLALSTILAILDFKLETLMMLLVAGGIIIWKLRRTT